ncbi:MAG TPA: AP2 domain-containing protein [Nitrospira sp.]|nr:AP2 domain-containing protein [Nitrospira sp.]
MAAPRLYAIQRIDHQRSRTHAWKVIIQRRKTIYMRYFSDGRHEGKEAALKAAKAYRDQLIARHPPMTRREVCVIRKTNNTSGVSGITRIDSVEWTQSRKVHRLYWDAQWPTLSGKPVHRKFSITLYGERRAFQLAVHARRQGLRQLTRAPFRPTILAHDLEPLPG